MANQAGKGNAREIKSIEMTNDEISTTKELPMTNSEKHSSICASDFFRH